MQAPSAYDQYKTYVSTHSLCDHSLCTKLRQERGLNLSEAHAETPFGFLGVCIGGHFTKVTQHATKHRTERTLRELAIMCFGTERRGKIEYAPLIAKANPGEYYCYFAMVGQIIEEHLGFRTEGFWPFLKSDQEDLFVIVNNIPFLFIDLAGWGRRIVSDNIKAIQNDPTWPADRKTIISCDFFTASGAQVEGHTEHRGSATVKPHTLQLSSVGKIVCSKFTHEFLHS